MSARKNQEAELICGHVSLRGCLSTKLGFPDELDTKARVAATGSSGTDAARNSGDNATSSTDDTAVYNDNTKPVVTVSIDSSNSAKSTIANRTRSDGSALVRPEDWQAKTNVAKTGDNVTLTITANEFIFRPTVVCKSGTKNITGSITYLDTKKDNQDDANKV